MKQLIFNLLLLAGFSASTLYGAEPTKPTLSVEEVQGLFAPLLEGRIDTEALIKIAEKNPSKKFFEKTIQEAEIEKQRLIEKYKNGSTVFGPIRIKQLESFIVKLKALQEKQDQ